MKKPILEDYYDVFNPEGCSEFEYNNYQRALIRWQRNQKGFVNIKLNLEDVKSMITTYESSKGEDKKFSKKILKILKKSIEHYEI